jgi:hypothetical protein
MIIKVIQLCKIAKNVHGIPLLLGYKIIGLVPSNHRSSAHFSPTDRPNSLLGEFSTVCHCDAYVEQTTTSCCDAVRI